MQYYFLTGVVSCLTCHRTVGSYHGLKQHASLLHGWTRIFISFEQQFPQDTVVAMGVFLRTRKPRPVGRSRPAREPAERGNVSVAIGQRAAAMYRAAVHLEGVPCQCHHWESEHVGGLCVAVSASGNVCECAEFFPAHRRRPNGQGRADALRFALSLDAPLRSNDGGNRLTIADTIPYYQDAYAV